MSNLMRIELIEKRIKYQEEYKTFIDIDIYDDYESHSIDIAFLYPKYANTKSLEEIEISPFDIFVKVIQTIQNFSCEILNMFTFQLENKGGFLINGSFYDYFEVEKFLKEKELK